MPIRPENQSRPKPHRRPAALLRAEVARLRAELAFVKREWVNALIPSFSYNQRRPVCASVAAAEGYAAEKLAGFRETQEGGRP